MTPPASNSSTLAWFHCFAGIAGDMALGSLVDAGADMDEVRALLNRLSLPGWHLDFEGDMRGGIACTRALVGGDDVVVRTHGVIAALIEDAALPPRVAARAQAVFHKLASVESALHRRPIDQVHFHEVGGHDAIIDVVGTAAALEVLGVDEVSASAVATGMGMVRSAHGRLPNPAPATIRLLEGIPSYGRDVSLELTTPTGAALLAALSTSFGPLPDMTVTASGFGGGAGEMEDLPNCTQVVIGRRVDRPPVGPGQGALLLETSLDDVTGEQLGLAIAGALEAGALDAWVSPVTMKKGRPGHVLHVLTDATLVEVQRARDPAGDRNDGDPRHRRGALAGRPRARTGHGRRHHDPDEGHQGTGEAGVRRRGAGCRQDGGPTPRGGQPGRGGLACCPSPDRRSGGSVSLMASQMFHYDEAMTDLVLAACRERLSMDPVALDFGGLVESLDAELAGLMRPEGNDAGKVLKLFVDKLSTAVVSCDSPRFLSFIPAAPTKASLLFDMFISCSSLHGTSWLEAAGVVVAENQALGVLAAQAGLPEEAGGCFVAGGSAGNLSALMVARDTAEHRRHAAAPLRPLVALSEDAHSSVGKALHVLGVGSLTVATRDHRLTGSALRSALREDPRRADVIGVVATAGTTNAGIVDDLAGVADVAAEHSLWFHIDGAYGGAAALFAPSVRAQFAGFERADSFIVDPHKWLFAPFDCAALVYRQPNLAKAVHTQDAQYLEVLHSENPEEWNPSDYAFHLTRRARGLPLWFSMAVNGLDAYREGVETGLSMAQRAAERVSESPHVELVRDPGLSIVLFRRPGWDKADYEAWSAALLHAQTGFVTPTTWEGETVARFAFLHPNTTLEMVDEILDSMVDA